MTKGLEDFETIRAEMLELFELRPQSAVLTEMRGRFDSLRAEEFDRLVAAGDLAPARERLLHHAPLLEFSALRTARAAIAGAPPIPEPELAPREERSDER